MRLSQSCKKARTKNFIYGRRYNYLRLSIHMPLIKCSANTPWVSENVTISSNKIISGLVYRIPRRAFTSAHKATRISRDNYEGVIMFLTKIQFAPKAGRYSWTRISILPCLLIPRLSSVTLMDVAGENQFVPICLVLLSPSLLSPFLSRDITVRERHFARAQHAAWSILNKEASRTLRVGEHA